MKLSKEGPYIVTGGAGGIGIGVCRALAKAGCRVALLDLDASAVDSAVSQIRTSGAVAGYVVDVRRSTEVKHAIDQVTAEFGAPMGVVNLAGGAPRDVPLHVNEISPELIDLIIDSNLKGAAYVSQAVFPHMRAAGRGSIVHISSLAGRTPSPMTDLSYHAAKAGVVGLVRRLAFEGAPDGVRVNALAPGTVFTPAARAVYDSRSAEVRGAIDASIPMGRAGRVEEIVEPILFLLSASASYITGATLDVNGGRFMP